MDYKNSPVTKQGKNHLLAIGINEYQYCSKLYNAVNDVEQFSDLMNKKFGFDSQSCHLLCNQEATSENIFNSLKKLVEFVEREDNVIIYFSGHGELDHVLGQGYWIPVEAQLGKIHQYIPNSTIQLILRRINSFHTFLIVDSCYSGSLFLEGESKLISAAYDFPSRWGLTSGRNTIVSDGKAGTNSPFAAALLSTLESIDKPLNVSALCDIIKQTVPIATNNLQKPIGDPLSMEGHKGGQFIFIPINRESALAEEQTYQEAIEANSISLYEQFIKRFREGEFKTKEKKADIVQRLRSLRASIAWEKIKNSTHIEDFDDFLDRFEDSPVAKLARQKINILALAADEKNAIPNPQNVSVNNQPSIVVNSNFNFEPKMIFVKGGDLEMQFWAEDHSLFSYRSYYVRKLKVSLSDFSIGKYPITIAQFAAFIKDTQYKTATEKNQQTLIRTKSGNPEWSSVANWRCDEYGKERSPRYYSKYPVIHINWHDAVAYCEWLANKTNKNYKLPTEAQWVFAARGGTRSKGFQYSGSDNLDEVGWYSANSGIKKLFGKYKTKDFWDNGCAIQKIGTKKGNELRIYDMSGNVEEWCSDFFNKEGIYYGSLVQDPKSPTREDYKYKDEYEYDSRERVVRGGSFLDWDFQCEVNSYKGRDSKYPSFPSFDVGFRVVVFPI